MSKTDRDLYRGVVRGTLDGPFVVDGKPVEGLLYPRFEASSYVDSAGVEQTSSEDILPRLDRETGEMMCDPGGGTSMHDVEGWFGFGIWRYFHVPHGTDYCADSLYIKRGKRKRTNKSKTLSGRHYQIEPKNPMTIGAYKGALDNFARSAVARQVALAKGRVTS